MITNLELTDTNEQSCMHDAINQLLWVVLVDYFCREGIGEVVVAVVVVVGSSLGPLPTPRQDRGQLLL